METKETTTVERHNAYGFVRPDADACYLCGRKEFTTPVEGFQVRECDRCERLVCEKCAEVDCGGEGEGVSWQCEGRCRPEPTVFDIAADEICNKLADELEAVDRKHGVSHDYSVLRVPTVEARMLRANRSETKGNQ
jgi:hypothetical protein